MRFIIMFSFILLIQLFIRGLFAEDLESSYGKIKAKPGWPMEINSPISGTFGEYRNYNLHMGADLKTYGLNGIRILATYDGYVSLISQKDKGYGRSMQLYSPELGLTTKYAHLYSFLGSKKELEFLRMGIPLLTGSREFQINLPANRFPVRKSDWLALSGESGTGGPHLHIEFRDNYGYINPLFFDSFRTEDLHYPSMVTLFWEDSMSMVNQEFKIEKVKEGKYLLPEPIPSKGKIRIKVHGYDFIRSKNKNNIYALELKKDKEIIYRKEFSYVSYTDSSSREIFYDTNRSSIIPPIYVFNLFDSNRGYSIDLSSYPIGSKLELQAILEDASGKKSILNIPVEVVNELPILFSYVQPNPSQGYNYYSSDKNFHINLKNISTSGSGSLILETVDWNIEGIKLPLGLKATSLAYKISSQNFNWKGKAPGFLQINRPPDKSESLYFYDTSIKKFQSIPSHRTKNGFNFTTEKLGILGILKDESPPKIEYVFQLEQYVHLPDAIHSNLIERYYYLSDIGSGFTEKPEVYLDGEVYPYEYDQDRKAIRILFPKKAFSNKKFLLLEIRPKDWAGNYGIFFTEILSL